MFENQVYPATSPRESGNPIGVSPNEVLEAGQEFQLTITEPIKQNDSPKLTAEFRARIWSIVNLLLPSFDIWYAAKSFLHVNFHMHSEGHLDDENDVHSMCETGFGAMFDILWIFELIGFILHYFISLLFLIAAFPCLKSQRLRIKFVKIYYVACICPFVLVAPVIHFVLKVSGCYRSTHFWIFFFVTVTFLLFPMVVLGALAAKHFLRWLKDPVRLLRAGEPILSTIAIATGTDEPQQLEDIVQLSSQTMQ